MLPYARVDDLLVRAAADETLVYDLKRHKAHCLNRTAALVWRHCDGRKTPAEIARLVQNELQITKAEPVVLLALDRLARAGLLNQFTPPADRPRSSRRELMKLGLAAALAPLVMTVLAPSAAMAASCATIGASCQHNPCCPGGTCVGNGSHAVCQ